ncbi:MBL fold metallo-hydrolase [Segetibacter sp.]|jgi:glyoxylase-like metal-dependent hydrolase (beta-lactamase superfamily II)|uniref:MBL fold metallo-hydrolase n=1 Tax=Segetibacter sp. TaxID=2231182 RepID=UPI00263482B3|nr:MBL fold metallo-hydrolase [Segetibacter sp.]MCW3079145.1 fold metallo-hydrolase [Segetibacter sp.]
MKIIPLSEGVFTIDKTKVFIPFGAADNDNDLQKIPAGSLLVEVQPFVVITSKDILLLDTGLGFTVDGKLQIYKNMEENGVDPAAVTKVLLTHLHKDHAGGVSVKDTLGHYSLAFPNATYYLPKDELDYAFEKGFPSYISQEFDILSNNNKVILLEENGSIDDYITYTLVGGHSPFHYAYWVKEDDEIIFFGGDVAPQLQQMKSRLVAKYDYDGKKSMELRQRWWQQGIEEGWTFLFYHDVKMPFYSAKATS